MNSSMSAEKKFGMSEMSEIPSKMQEQVSPVRSLLECNAIVLAMLSLLLLNYL